MKWFKHISDSLDDPFIFDLMNKFGSDGYLVFFGVLEIYSREFKTKHDWKLTVTRSYLSRKLNKRQSTLVMKCLKHIQKSGKWEITFNDEQVIIFIPKFTQIIDGWTRRKLRSSAEVSPEILPLEEEVEEEVEKKKIKRKIPDVFPLTNKLKEYALKKGIFKNEVDRLFESFKKSHGSKGTVMLDWNLCWHTWVLNEIKWHPEKYIVQPEQKQESIEEQCS